MQLDTRQRIARECGLEETELQFDQWDYTVRKLLKEKLTAPEAQREFSNLLRETLKADGMPPDWFHATTATPEQLSQTYFRWKESHQTAAAENPS